MGRAVAWQAADEADAEAHNHRGQPARGPERDCHPIAAAIRQQEG